MLRDQQEYGQHQGLLGVVGGIRGSIRGYQGCIAAGRECRYSGASKGISGIGGS